MSESLTIDDLNSLLNDAPAEIASALVDSFGNNTSVSNTFNTLNAASNDTQEVTVDVSAEVVVEDSGDDTIYEDASEDANENPENTEDSAITVENSDVTILSKVDEYTIRFNSAPWFEFAKNLNIVLVGAGGIGSWCGISLGRLCSNGLIDIYDGDRFETVNMAGQLVSKKDIGCYKAHVLSSRINAYCDKAVGIGACENITLEKLYNSLLYHNTSAIVIICGADNMEARRECYAAFSRYSDDANNSNNKILYIDGRLSAEVFQIFTLVPSDTYNRKLYEDKYLFSDKEAEEEVCSYKQTSHVAQLIGGFIVNQVANWSANESNDKTFDRPLPFYIEYNAIVGSLITRF